MTTHYKDDIDTDALSPEEVLSIAMNSDNKSVQEAFKKLEFLIRLSHSQEDIDRLSRQIPTYHMRVGIPIYNQSGEYTYENVHISLRGSDIDLKYSKHNVFGRLKQNKENIFYMRSLK